MVKPAKSRLDELLVRRGIADSISTARAFIMSGDVIVNDQRIDKSGSMIDDDAKIRLRTDGKFVSRGGDKLEAAIEDLGLGVDFKHKVVLDIGASTGGFTDCVLFYGAQKVLALDVGTAQLDWKLRQDPRVVSIEKTDIKEFKCSSYPEIDWAIADVSFTSLAKLVPHIKKSAPKAKILILVKPQFELPRELVPPGGIITQEEDRQLALKQVKDALVAELYQIENQIDCRVPGRQGNREIFILAVPKTTN